MPVVEVSVAPSSGSGPRVHMFPFSPWLPRGGSQLGGLLPRVTRKEAFLASPGARALSWPSRHSPLGLQYRLGLAGHLSEKQQRWGASWAGVSEGRGRAFIRKQQRVAGGSLPSGGRAGAAKLARGRAPGERGNLQTGARGEDVRKRAGARARHHLPRPSPNPLSASASLPGDSFAATHACNFLPRGSFSPL